MQFVKNWMTSKELGPMNLGSFFLRLSNQRVTRSCRVEASLFAVYKPWHCFTSYLCFSSSNHHAKLFIPSELFECYWIRTLISSARITLLQGILDDDSTSRPKRTQCTATIHTSLRARGPPPPPQPRQPNVTNVTAKSHISSHPPPHTTPGAFSF